MSPWLAWTSYGLGTGGEEGEGRRLVMVCCTWHQAGSRVMEEKHVGVKRGGGGDGGGALFQMFK